MRPLAGRRVRLGGAWTGAWLLSLVLVLPASADWQVKRDSGRAVREQALRALLANPADEALAGKIVRGAGQDEVARMLERVGQAAGAPSARFAPVLAHAQILLAMGRTGEAAVAFARAAALKPEDPAPPLGQARALEREGKLQESLAAYQQAATRERGPTRRRTILKTAAALATRAGASAPEIAIRRQLVDDRPGDRRGVLELARALGRAGQPSEGATLVEGLLLRSAGQVQLLAFTREAAALHEAAGEHEAAEKLLRGALEGGSGATVERLELFRQVVGLALRRGRGLDLEPWLEHQARDRAGPGGIAAWQALAELREELGDDDRAARAWREVKSRDRGNTTATRKLVALLDRLGREDEVTRIYDGSTGAGIDTETELEMIERKYRQGERQDAVARFDRAVRRLRRSPAALVRLADLASRWNEGERVLACWDALSALDPRDERAIVGLGEAHFQAGRRELARRTWHGLLRVVRPPAVAHARLAELLGDHDLLDEALPLARAAQKLEPSEPAHHRTLARILERKRELSAAVSEWRAVLQKSRGPERGHERREARGRIVNLLAREGRERLRAETVLLKDRLGRHPEDRESALFLAELQIRLQAPAEAVVTLTAAAEASPADAEVVLMLVRLLRQSRQSDRAVVWLERFAAKLPARAPEALLQIAEIRLERYEDRQALSAAEQAVEVSGRAPPVLMRAAELQDRAGQTDQALASFRAALGGPASAKAALAAADLLVRRGEATAALEILRAAGGTTSDPEARADLMARELDIAEYAGELPLLLKRLAEKPMASSPAERRLVVELYRRVLPELYRAAGGDVAAQARWKDIAGTASRPLIALLIDPEGEPEPAIIELAGMIGNRDVIPVLLRLTRPEGRHSGSVTRSLDREPGNLAGSAAEAERVVLAAVIALGRLKAGPGLNRLLELSSHPEVKLRAAAIWALGRLAVPEAADRLSAAVRDPRAEVAAFAALGLGRMRTTGAVPLLRTVAFDASSPIDVRRASLVALATAGAPDVSDALLALLDAPEPALARAAAFSLAVLRDRMILPLLWGRALMGSRQAQEVAVLALAAMASDVVVTDDAPTVRGSRLEASELLDDLCVFPAEPAQMELLWIEHAPEIGQILERALRSGTEERRRALLALDSRSGGIGLGRLLQADTVVSTRAERALEQIGNQVREPLAPLLTDSDAVIRLRALRLATKMSDPKVTTTHIVAALRDAVGRGKMPTWGGLDPARVAVEALAGLKARGRLDVEGLWREARLLLDHPAWAVRLATIEALTMSGQTPPDLQKKALADGSPLVRSAARQLGPRTAREPARRQP